MEKLITLLKDGSFHSGEELGALLGISRAAVWKKIQHLSELGLELDAVRGKGYRLPAGIEFLDRASIDGMLADGVGERVGMTLPLSTSSTNDAVRSQNIEDRALQVCIAEHQSAGRDRLRRVWQSPLGGALAISLLWKLDNEVLAALDGFESGSRAGCLAYYGATGLFRAGSEVAERYSGRWPEAVQCAAGDQW